ncbi:T9SS type A sorting domain-containing protein [Segetibacter sp. 3557_3]|uniref:RCC1 domain-containing protein n=1 Tax=Segetibacter sp. 3557_3 TaxID=2547429 RepID=UPI0010588DD8|nr:T9SS type A sorting domain-containing protein [Segetibacter sp. 3557_3]TDH27774.1 T9SS type A sorting domain-containing protein [Segetibacter sp. 3557_3]
MKSFLFSFFLAVFCTIIYSADAQVNRSNNKSSVPYRANYQRLAAGGVHTLEIRNGTIWAWGSNENGALGTGSNAAESNIPVQVGSENNWIAVSAGYASSFAIKSNGTLWAWGRNVLGELGIGTTVSSNVPVQVGVDNRWVSVAANIEHVLALKSDGSLWAWGLNLYGQLGNGATLPVVNPLPVRVGTENNWLSITVGRNHSAALKADGTLWTWGANGSGELGIGTYTNSSVPVPVLPNANNRWKSVFAGGSFTMAVRSDGTLWGWGNNNEGQLGTSNTTYSVPTPVQSGSDNNWVMVQGGGSHTLALKSNGTLWSWGANLSGQLGNGTTSGSNANPVPAQVGTDTKWVGIATGFAHSLGFKSDGTLFGWGNNEKSQLGNGTNTNVLIPMLLNTDVKWLDVKQGALFTTALATDGRLWTWESNTHGQLGNGNQTQQNSPGLMNNDNNWISVAAGFYYTLALKSNGTLWSWGGNFQGQLGNGTNTTFNQVPTQVGNDNKWTSIAAKGSHSLALKSDGTLWAWGNNADGQLGVGNTTVGLSPVQVGSDNKWASISVGFYHSIGLKSDGTLWSWGTNFWNGSNSTGNYLTPVKIGSDSNWKSIATGVAHTLAIKSDGTLWAWGYNLRGQVGNGTLTNVAAPMQIGTDNQWINIAAGNNHSVALKSDGSVWAWGENAFGQYGNGSSGSSLVPVQVGQNTTVLSAANENSAIIPPNRNTICLAGDNSQGQIGNGTTTPARTFTCLTSGGPLPVSFTAITAYRQGSIINVAWNVHNETRIRQYDIEVSHDGRSFAYGGSQLATGNNMSSVSYAWADVNAKSGDNFYRVKTIEISGEIRYSSIVKVTIGKSAPAYRLYPNPVTNGVVNLQFINQPAGRFNISLVDAIGQTIVTKQVDRLTGSSTESFRLSRGLSSGKYGLVIYGPDNKKQTFQIILNDDIP